MRRSVLLCAFFCATSLARATVLSLNTPQDVQPTVVPGGTIDIAVLVTDNTELSAAQIQLDLSQAQNAEIATQADIAAGDLFDGLEIVLLPASSQSAAIIYLSDLFSEVSDDGELLVFTLTFPTDAQLGSAWVGLDESATLITDGNDDGIRELLPFQTGGLLEIRVIPEPTALWLMGGILVRPFLRRRRFRTSK